jgi:hypothetical protein
MKKIHMIILIDVGKTYHKINDLKKYSTSWALVAHNYNPSKLGDLGQENCSSRPARANSSWDPHLQNNKRKID